MKTHTYFQGIFLILLCITSNSLLISAQSQSMTPLTTDPPITQPPVDIPTDDDEIDQLRNQLEVSNEIITFSVTGFNVPMYSFWLTSQETIRYEVKFLLLFEIIDQNKDGIYTPDIDRQVPASSFSLPSLSWDFSEIQETTENSKHFNITSVGGPFTIQFRNHFSQNSYLKFDIVIQNYTFVSLDENAMLVLGFHLLSSGQVENTVSSTEQDNEDQSDEKRVNFGNQGYFSSMKTASSNETDINIGVSEGREAGDPIVYLAFQKFSDTVILDPKIGIDLTSPPILPKSITTYIIVGVIVIGIIFGLMMTKQEYRQFILNRIHPVPKNRHNLSLEEVFENEKRDELIDIILNNPGIHFNELRRQAKISSGNLVWHLNILESYKIIKAERIGHFIVYFPCYDKNPITKVDFLIKKSTVTLKIMQIIEENPGIYQNQIIIKSQLKRSTVKYHLDKLIKAEIVISKKMGTKRCYFVTKETKSEKN
ncbi:MAG: winged helix-turn-helix transcriptional regulator [Promethearchaeota archaeon]